VIRLAARITLAGGRESAVRLALTALGVALGVCLLLFAAVAFPALHAHDVRNGWVQTSSHNTRPADDEATTDPLLWRVRTDRFGHQKILRVDVAAEGPRAPIPDFLSRLPKPGEVAASPAMRTLLHDTDPAQLGDRYRGRVDLTVARQGLQSDDQLVVVVGRSPASLATEDGVSRVLSIEGAPFKHGFTDFLRLVLVVGALALLVPIVVFVATATRLAAARREQRLAAMRLAGATPLQAGTVAAVEAALAAITGTAVGFVAFFLARPYAARIPLDGYSFYSSDLHLAPGWALLIGVGVPALAVVAALVSLRRVRISPLGVTSRVAHRRPTARRLILLAFALVFFAVSLTYAVHESAGVSGTAQAVVGLAFVLIVLGIVLSGPWLTTLVANAMGRIGRSAPGLLASRRLQDNPSGGFRAISGLILAVFVATMVSALAASAAGSNPTQRSNLSSSTVGIVANQVRIDDVPNFGSEAPTSGALPASAAAQLVGALHALSGVHDVVEVHALPTGVTATRLGDQSGSTDIGVVSCSGAARLGIAECSGTIGVDVSGGLTGDDRSLSPPLSQAVPTATLPELPLLGVAVATDGRRSTIERVRTRLERAFAGAQALTGTDIDADRNAQLRDTTRLSNVALVVTLLIAGCSLAIAVAGGLVERKRPFALLRLAGMPLRQLHRVVIAEAAAPLLIIAAVCVGLGLAVSAILVGVTGGAITFHLPAVGYWLALGAGLIIALGIASATLPLLDRLTSLDAARFE
jgi:hypothetical protein